jgi:hypothetical protein
MRMIPSFNAASGRSLEGELQDRRDDEKGAEPGDGRHDVADEGRLGLLQRARIDGDRDAQRAFPLRRGDLHQPLKDDQRTSGWAGQQVAMDRALSVLVGGQAEGRVEQRERADGLPPHIVDDLPV